MNKNRLALKINLAIFLALFLTALTGCSWNSIGSLSLIESERKIQLKALLAEEPKNAQYHYQLALIYFKQKNYKSASLHVQTASRVDPTVARYIELVGDIAYKTERYGSSLSAYTSAIKINPDLISVYLKLGFTYEKIGDIERTIDTLEKVIQLEPRYFDALLHLSAMYLKIADFNASLTSIDRALKLNAKHPMARLIKIRALSSKGDYYFAKILTLQLLRDEPTFDAAKVEYLRILLFNQEFDLAFKTLKFYEKEGLSFRLKLMQAQLLLRANNLAKSELILKDLQTKNPKNTQVMLSLALLNLNKNNLAQASVWIKRSLQIDSASAQAHFLLANIYYQNGDILQGDLSLNRALDKQPNNVNYILLSLKKALSENKLSLVEKKLAVLSKKYELNIEVLKVKVDLLMLKGEYRNAEILVKQLQIVQPSDVIDFYYARVLYFQQRYFEALDISKKIVSKNPSSWEASYIAALSLQRLNKANQAQLLLRPFINKNVGFGFIDKLSGDFYRLDGNNSQAKTIYERSYRSNPNNIYLAEALISLLIEQKQFNQAFILLEKVLDKSTFFREVMLNRLILVSSRLNRKQDHQKYLKLYHKSYDPVLNGRASGTPSPILFPINFTSFDFKSATVDILQK